MEKEKKSWNFTMSNKNNLRFVSMVSLFLWCFVLLNLRFVSLFSQSGLKTIISMSSTNFMSKDHLCSGRYIYIHDIPGRFNTDILQNCTSLLKWPQTDMCKSISNLGLGPLIENSSGVLQNESWFITHPNLLEVIFHNRMKQYKCLTKDSSLASLMFIPYYGGLDLGRYLWGFNSSVRNSGAIDLFKWLVEKPEWRNMWGRDHFFVVGRTTYDFRQSYDSEWGNNLMFMPQVENMTILSIESIEPSIWTYQDFSIPYPTHFHPSNDNQVFEWQNHMRERKRPHFFSFVGLPRPQMNDSIRNEIIDQCVSSGVSCKWLQCSAVNCDDPIDVMPILESSVFCLQPRGDTATRRSTFDSILAGCIPVFFNEKTAYTQYLWHLPKNYTEYSVYIPEETIKDGSQNIEKRLRMISEDEIHAMRENVIRLIPRILYANPASKMDTIEDAFDLAIKGVLERVKTMKQEGKA